jgi:hypothetical protein
MARLDHAMADPAGIDDRDDAPLGEGVLLARRAQVQVVLEQQPQRLPAVRILRVDAGLLGTMLAPVGSGTQYGAGNPWPWDRFGSGCGPVISQGGVTRLVHRMQAVGLVAGLRVRRARHPRGAHQLEVLRAAMGRIRQANTRRAAMGV